MRNLLRTCFSYLVALLTAFWCMLTAGFHIMWYTVVAIIFGFIVVYAMTDMLDRWMTTWEQVSSEAQASEETEGNIYE